MRAFSFPAFGVRALSLAVIDPATGRARDNETFRCFLAKHYPALAEASPAEILAHIQADDTFSASIPVFTYDGADIIEKRCEVLGWPNVTHDGALMYENSYSQDRSNVICWAKRNAQLQVKSLSEEIVRVHDQLSDLKSRLSCARTQTERLEAEHPSLSAGAVNGEPRAAVPNAVAEAALAEYQCALDDGAGAQSDQYRLVCLHVFDGQKNVGLAYSIELQRGYLLFSESARPVIEYEPLWMLDVARELTLLMRTMVVPDQVSTGITYWDGIEKGPIIAYRFKLADGPDSVSF